MKRITTLCAAWFIAGSVHAQVLSLAPAYSPTLGKSATASLDVGVSLEDDSNYYGGRLNYALSENLLVFGNLGFVDIDDVDIDGPAFGAGLLVDVPTELNFSTGVRLEYNYAMLEGDVGPVDVDVDVWMLSALAVASGGTGVEGLTWNGHAGLAHFDGDLDDDTEPHIGGGLNLQITERVSGFFALDHVDDLFVGLGARVDLN